MNLIKTYFDSEEVGCMFLNHEAPLWPVDIAAAGGDGACTVGAAVGAVDAPELDRPTASCNSPNRDYCEETSRTKVLLRC